MEILRIGIYRKKSKILSTNFLAKIFEQKNFELLKTFAKTIFTLQTDHFYAIFSKIKILKNFQFLDIFPTDESFRDNPRLE